jgi:hypothetical protein
MVVTSQSRLRHVQGHHQRVAIATYKVTIGVNEDLSNLS